MKDLTIVLLIGILAFMMWNKDKKGGESFTDSANAVTPATIQSIVNSIQARDPDVYPVQTIYINQANGDQGSVIYNARILFINTRGYFGIQYDVQSDANGNILNISEQPLAGLSDAFKITKQSEYAKFEDTQAVLDQQFATLKTQAPGYQGKLDLWLEQMRANSFKQAGIDANVGKTN